MMPHCTIASPLGYIDITGDDAGISSICINNNRSLASELIPEDLKECVNQLSTYFKGELQTFNLKLNPEGTDFQKKVWNQLQLIPFGKTISYQDLAERLGNPKTIRAAANANGKNPIWIVIPCHRVIGKDGTLTGYAGGLHRKQWLLEHESPYQQHTLF